MRWLLLVSSVLVSSLPLTVVAQSGLNQLPSLGGASHDITIADASVPPTWTYGKTVLGYFNRDPILDAVYRREGRTALLVNPSIYDCRITAPFDAKDIAVLPGTATAHRDELVALTAGGITAWTAGTSGFSGTPRVVSDTLDAQNARLLACGDMDFDGDHDIVTVRTSAARDYIDIYYLDQDGVVDTQIPVVSVLYEGSGSIQQLALFEWSNDNDNALEVIVLDSEGIANYSVHYENWFTIAQNSSEPSVAMSPYRNENGEPRLAWITRPSGSNVDTLKTVDAGGVLLELQLYGPVAGVASGALDNSGGEDLVFSFENAHLLLVLFDTNDAFSLNNAKKVVASQQGVSDNTAWPAVGDLDGDSDTDVGYPVQDEDLFHVHLNDAFDEAELTPLLGDVTFDPATNTLRVSSIPPGDLPSVVTQTEFVVWRMPSPSAAGGTLNPIAIYRCFAGPPNGAPQAEIPLDGSSLGDLYFVFVRFVKTSRFGQNLIYDIAYPCTMFACTLAGDPADHLAYLSTLSWTGTPADIFVFEGGGPNPIAGPEAVGTLVPVRPLPDFPDDEDEPNTNPAAGQ
ncbi:MAG: hypothetical protein AB7O52_06345 [Planctomycetota bacterium]